MKRLFALLFCVFAMVFVSLGQYDLSNYKPLQSQGPIPSDISKIVVADKDQRDYNVLLRYLVMDGDILYGTKLNQYLDVIVDNLMKDDLVSQKGVCLANSSYLREWFALNKVPVYLETTLKEVKDGSIICTEKSGKDIEIACDSVISCAGYIPAPIAEKSGKVHLVGDCLAIGNLRSVIWRAYDVAMKI